MSKKPRFWKSPKWRHGWLSWALLCALTAACVLACIAVDRLESEYGWRRDMSFNAYTTTGDDTRRVLDELTSPVKLYALYQTDGADEQLLEILNRYHQQTDLVTVLPTDITKNPGILTQFQSEVDSSVQSGSVIVSCESTGRYKALAYTDFVAQGYNVDEGTFEIAGLRYEQQITEAIVYVTQEAVPTVAILQGHGELTEAELENFTDFLKRNNYDVKTLNLTSGETTEGVDLILIACPQKDITEGELSQLKSFTQEGGSLLCLRDYTDPLDGMTGYLSLLKSYGVTPLPGVVVASEEDVGSYYGERIYLMPYMNSLDFTLPLVSNGMDVLLLAGACAFDVPETTDASLAVATVLKSGPNAYIRDPSDGNTSIDQQPGDRTGELSLGVYSNRMHSTGEISRLFILGNSSLLTDEYVYQRTFNQEFLLQLMGELLPQKSVSLDILAKAAFHPALTAGSQTLGLCLIALVPLLVLGAGLTVLLPRRNR